MTKENPHSLSLFLRYSRTCPLLLSAYLFLAPLSALVEIGLAAAIAAAVDYALSGTLENIGAYIVVYLGYVLLELLVGYGCKRLRFSILSRMTQALKDDLHGAILAMPYMQFREGNSAAYLAELTDHAESVRNSYFSIFLSLYPEALQFAVAGAAMLWISPLLGGYVLLLACLQLTIPVLFSKKLSEKGEKTAGMNKAYMVTAKENLLSHETSTLFQITGALNLRHAEKNKAAERARLESKSMNSLCYELSFALGDVMYLGIYLVGAFLALTGHIGVPSIVAASQLMVYIARPLTTISSDIAELKSAAKVVGNILRLLCTPPAPQEGKPCSFTDSIALQDVSFSYDGKPVLEQLSYRFQKGKKYMILGESGCGKSTLLKLLSRLLSPGAGMISLDGVDIQSIDRKGYAEIVGCVPQEPYLFDDTILENVRLYRPFTEAQVMDALQKAGLYKYVLSLPNGIHTNPGENANQMSGGEKQRLAIARALLASPQILLVDEGTSHLDTATATDIESLIFSISDTTVIFVSHILRDQTLHMADTVLDIRGGIITERKDS